MLRKLLAQNMNRSNRITLFILLPNGEVKAVEPTFFECQKSTKNCDQRFPLERPRSAMLRVATLALGYKPASAEVMLVRQFLLPKSSTSTRYVFVVLYKPSDPKFKPSEHLSKFLIDPENPPVCYTIPTQRRLLKEFAQEVKARFASDPVANQASAA